MCHVSVVMFSREKTVVQYTVLVVMSEGVKCTLYLSDCHSTFFSPFTFTVWQNELLSISGTERVDDSAFTKLHFVFSDDREWFLLFDLLLGAWHDQCYPPSWISYGIFLREGKKIMFINYHIYVVCISCSQFLLGRKQQQQQKTACKIFGVKIRTQADFCHNVASVWLATHNWLPRKCR